MKQFKENKIIEIKDIPLCKWLKCYDSLKEFGFTDAKINKAIEKAGLNLNLLTDRKGYENLNIFSFWKTPYSIVNENYFFNKKVFKGVWEKVVRVNGYEVRVPSQYQGLNHGKIIYNLLKDRFSWFEDDIFFIEKVEKLNIFPDDYSRLKDIPKEFQKYSVKDLLSGKIKKTTIKKSKWDIYELCNYKNHTDEIYLSTEHGSLYIPYTAIFEGNSQIIIDRMESYALSYHDPIKLSGFALNGNGRTKEEYKKDKEQDYLKMILPLKSKEAKYLFKMIDNK